MSMRLFPVCPELKKCYGKEFLHGAQRCTILRRLSQDDIRELGLPHYKDFYTNPGECPFCKENRYYTNGKYYPKQMWEE